MKRVFGSAGQRIGQRVFLRLLEHDRVVDDGGGLLGDAIEQPAVIVGVDRRRRCGRRRCVPMNRSLKTSGQTSADCSVVCDGRCPAASKSALGRALTSGRRLRATQPVRPVAVPDRQLLDDLGLDAGREPAAQRLGLLVVEEQRAARERHDVAQLRRDERHRVGHAEAAAHGLRDLVERVDLAVRERDVLEDVGARRRLVARGRRPAAPPARATARASACAPAPGWPRLRRASAGYSSMNVCTTRGSSALPLSCCSRPMRGVEAHRLVVRPLRHQRVEVVDDRQDARAERDLVALEARRVALAVPALVVAEDERRDRIGKRHAADDLGADLRVNADLLELLLRQRARASTGCARAPRACRCRAAAPPS